MTRATVRRRSGPSTTSRRPPYARPGSTDFGGTEHEEGLRLLCEDLATNGGLTPEGNYMQRTFIKSALVGRLLFEHGFKEHPSYAEVPIERPIFVCGLPRTGTTALHRLLNADPAHQGLELWLTEVPAAATAARDVGREPDLRRAERRVLRAPHRQPRVHGHPLHGRLLASRSAGGSCARPASRSATSRWPTSRSTPPGCEQQDWTDAYARHKANLQLIGLNDPEKQWVLKNPSHLVGARRDHVGLPRRADRATPTASRSSRSRRRARCRPRRPRAGRPRSSATRSAAPSSTC